LYLKLGFAFSENKFKICILSSSLVFAGIVDTAMDIRNLNIYELGNMAGQNMLMFASKVNDYDSVRLLLDSDFKVDYEDNKNYNAMDYVWNYRLSSVNDEKMQVVIGKKSINIQSSHRGSRCALRMTSKLSKISPPLSPLHTPTHFSKPLECPST